MIKFFTKKSLGQNFLINQGILDKIVVAAEIKTGDQVIEVGPGTGNLTEKLLNAGAYVIAIEKDHRLIEDLKIKFSGQSFEVREADALEFKPEISGDYKVIGNIPYYITSHLLKTIFDEWVRPDLVVLTIQKEVAQRIVARPPDMNMLALAVQYYSTPEIISYVSAGSFRPIPKVDSAIIKLIPNGNKPDPKLFSIARKAFEQKRKQLTATIPLEALEKAGIPPKSRPEELTLESWQKLAEILN